VALIAGVGGAVRNACVAVCTPDLVLGVCEQERITRVRGAGLNPSGLPDEALDELLRQSGRRRDELTAIAGAEETDGITNATPVRVAHHFAHACAAFLPSPFECATVLVCDHEPPYVSVWRGQARSITRLEHAWEGLGFAQLYSQCANALGFIEGGQEQRMEALARIGRHSSDEYQERVRTLFESTGQGLRLASDWKTRLATMGRDADVNARSSLAAGVQMRIADLLLGFVESLPHTAGDGLCLGGSLFNDSYINARVRMRALERRVYVPINPGNAGLSVGTALHAVENARLAVTPFLGPSYSEEEIKATLDNCKLTYQWAAESQAIDVAVRALMKGRLVAWFDGPMEWGPRALGGRSILANPFAPYVLDNLNRFLKHREVWRGYALSGLESAVREHFIGPDASPFMECDYRPRNPDCFQHILPSATADVRVQTVGLDGPSRFRSLLTAFGKASGIPVLVNTSFNGFREPIVCSPRDAVRVFYGTGIDLLIMGQFIVTK
jgi:carbamoyltransferase